METTQLIESASTAHILPNAAQLYQAALQALNLQAGDYLILDPLVDEQLLQAILVLGGRPVFIDLSADDTCIDPQLLEDFLSLSTLINANDQLVYRKDEQVIRALLLTQNAIPQAVVTQLQFIAQRYHLPLLEEFTHCFGHPDCGRHGEIAVARVSTPAGQAGLLLQRAPRSSPLTFTTTAAQRPVFVPAAALEWQEDMLLLTLPIPMPDPVQRLATLKEYTFLTRNQIAQKVLQTVSKTTQQ